MSRFLVGSKAKLVLWIAPVFFALGCASHSGLKNKVNEGVTTHFSSGVKVYSSKKNTEVRAALLNRQQHLLTGDSLYIYVANNSGQPINLELGQIEMSRRGRKLRLRPLAEIVAAQEQLSSEALNDAKWPKNIFGESFDGKTRTEIKKATAAALGNANKPAASADPIIDALVAEKLISPREARNNEQVQQAHQAAIAALQKSYLQPSTIENGKTTGGFIKYEPKLAETNVPVLVKIAIGSDVHEITLDAPAGGQ